MNEMPAQQKDTSLPAAGGISSLRRGLDRIDWIFLFLAALMLPMLWFEYVVGVDHKTQQYFHWYFLFLWAIFSVEFFFRFAMADKKISYIKHNWIEVVIIFFPFLRLLRLFRPLELALILMSYRFARAFPGFRPNAFFNLFVFIVVMVAVSSELILLFEQHNPESQIRTFGDALWWSTIGISTIGLGNIVPVSIAGKVLTLVLAVMGVFVFSILTAQIADLLITEEKISRMLKREGTQLAAGESEILRKLEHIEERLEEIGREHHIKTTEK